MDDWPRKFDSQVKANDIESLYKMTYYYLNWRNSLHLNSQNKPNNFMFILPNPIALEGSWEVALIDYKIKTSNKDPIYAFSDICEDSFACGGLQPVLARLDAKVGSIIHPNFIKVAKPEFCSIKVYLKDCSMKDLTVQDFYCTLCLRRIGNNIS